MNKLFAGSFRIKLWGGFLGLSGFVLGCFAYFMMDDFGAIPPHFYYFAGCLLLLSFGLAWWMEGIFSKPLHKLAHDLSEVIAGKIVDLSHSYAVPEYQTIQDHLRKLSDEQSHSTRIRSALDCVTTNVMVADADLNIRYFNPALLSMLSKVEPELKKELPQFDTKTMMGKNIDIFHKNPAHQRRLLDGLYQTYKTKIVVAGNHFELIANPVMNAANERTGFVVEWKNITEQVAIEAEVNNMVDAITDGRFDQRIGIEGKEGFMKGLSEKINSLAGAVTEAYQQIEDVIQAAQKGELDYHADLAEQSGLSRRFAEGILSFMRITRESLDDVGRALKSLSQKDLTYRIEKEYHGQFDRLKQDANRTMERLSDMISNITETASSIQGASSEISVGSDDLSSRAEQQAASLEETAASMEELSSTIRQNSENSGQANQLSAAARETANQGGEVVKQAVEAMHGIATSSQRIEDIISVIDEIAFQTNLLALNAAVEAARAGEAGKGFAVVASEVRALAQRSSASSKEIKDLIIDGAGKVKVGVELVNNTGETLEEIMSSIKRVADIVSEISAASQEQSSGVEQISTAIAQLDEITQHNAALSEESAAAARSLNDQSMNLMEMINEFRLKDTPPANDRKEDRAPATKPRMSVKAASSDVKPQAKPQAKAAASSAPRPPANNPTKKSVSQDLDHHAVSGRKVSGMDDDWEEF